MKSYKQLIEDIELVGSVSKGTSRDIRSANKEYRRDSKGPFPPENLGKIYRGYSIHRDLDDEIFYITHDKTKEVVGTIGNDTSTRKRLKVALVQVHPKHTKSQIGHSLAVAAYKHLWDKHGYEIESGDQQSEGGKSVWKTLIRNPSTRDHVYAFQLIDTASGAPRRLYFGKAKDMEDKEIWFDAGTLDALTDEMRLVLRRKTK